MTGPNFRFRKGHRDVSTKFGREWRTARELVVSCILEAGYRSPGRAAAVDGGL